MRDIAFPDLRRFFAPRAVAFIGATEDLRKFGGRLMRQLIDFGYAGSVYPVNPRRETIFGRRAYPAVTELPETPDHVGIVLPAADVPGALEQCAALGVPFVTVFSSGFAETGTAEGRALQQRVRDIARAGKVRVMGPNCNGFVNFVDVVALTSTATITGPRAPAGDIGVVSHSGGAGQVNVMWRAQQEGLGISYQVSCGNDADLDLLDYMSFMVEDASTRVVLALAERIPDGDRLRALAERAAELDKPIAMVKVGRSEAGSRAAASHTGAVTGADEVCSAALEQFGIIRVDDCSELYEVAMLLRSGRRPRGRRAAATSVSGGNLVMLADLGGTLGIEWPAFEPATQARVQQMLPGFGSVANPTDLTSGAIGKDDLYTELCEVLHDDPNVDALVPVITFAPAADILSLERFAARAEKPVAILWTGKSLDDPELTPRTLIGRGQAVYRDALPALKALARGMRYGEWQAARASRPVPQRPEGIDRAAAERLLEGRSGTLNEHDSKALLAAYGIPVTREAVADSADAAARIAADIGAEVALKVLSADLPHKTESGGIRLGVAGEAAVRAGFEELVQSLAHTQPQARIDGVLVQEMVRDAQEMLLGIASDPVFGPVVTVGAGGIYTEVLADVALGCPPIDAALAREMIGRLRSRALLGPVRGRPARDVDALADAIVRLSWLALDFRGRIAELDINPFGLLGAGDGARAMDALVVLGEPA